MGEAIAFGRGFLGFLSLFYWGLGLLCLYLALSKPKTIGGRTAFTALVLVIFGYLPATIAYERWQHQRYKEAAYAHFKKMCTEKAGEKIRRTAANVDGLLIAKPRQRASDVELRDQFWMGDPYGYSTYEAMNPAYVYLETGRGGTTVGGDRLTPFKAYKYVEMPNAAYGSDTNVKRYLRVRLKEPDDPGVATSSSAESRLHVDAVPELSSQYAISWEDISTREDRHYWVAGGRLVVFDVRTKAILAERVGYVIDPMLGALTQGRRIWLHVNNSRHAFCPSFEHEFYKNREFVAKVLKP